MQRKRPERQPTKVQAWLAVPTRQLARELAAAESTTIMAIIAKALDQYAKRRRK